MLLNLLPDGIDYYPEMQYVINPEWKIVINSSMLCTGKVEWSNPNYTKMQNGAAISIAKQCCVLLKFSLQHGGRCSQFMCN